MSDFEREAAKGIHSGFNACMYREQCRAASPLAPSVPPIALAGEPVAWKLVPVEPTDDMELEAENDYEQTGATFPDWKSAYRAMLAVAPVAIDENMLSGIAAKITSTLLGSPSIDDHEYVLGMLKQVAAPSPSASSVPGAIYQLFVGDAWIDTTEQMYSHADKQFRRIVYDAPQAKSVHGTYACPICGVDTPHYHTKVSNDRLMELVRRLVGGLWLEEAVKGEPPLEAMVSEMRGLLCAAPPANPAPSALTDSMLDEICRLAGHLKLAEFRIKARALLQANGATK